MYHCSLYNKLLFIEHKKNIMTSHLSLADHIAPSHSHVFGRSTKVTYPVAVRGEGIYVYDNTGKRYIDASGGACVCCLGHGHVDVVRAIKEQIDKLAYTHTGSFTNEPQEALADKLVAHAPPGLNHAFFVTGGSEAVESALKLARQYHVERGQPQRRHIVARQFSYHGNTLGALSASGHRGRREPYLPLLIEMHHIAPCFAYRHQLPGESDEAYGLRAANELELMVQTLGVDAIAAFIAEPVVGATIGAAPAVAGYFKRIREICDRYGILLILDEVMCGMGRTGTTHACEQEGITPDILVMAKGLGAGYQPIGALLIADHIYDAIATGSGAFNHGHTYMGHAVGCAAALAVQNIIERDALLDNVNRQGQKLSQALIDRFGDHPNIGDIRGRGLMWALEFVIDRDTKKPFDPVYQLHQRLKDQAMRLGLICYPSGGTVDGKSGDHLMIAPPFTVTDLEIEEIISVMGNTIDATITDIRTQTSQAGG